MTQCPQHFRGRVRYLLSWGQILHLQLQKDDVMVTWWKEAIPSRVRVLTTHLDNHGCWPLPTFSTQGKGYFQAANQNSDIAVVFMDRDSLYGTDNLAIGRQLLCDLDLWLWPSACVTCCAPHCETFTKFHQVLLIRYVTLWPWIYVVYRLSHDQPLYQIWVEVNNSP